CCPARNRKLRVLGIITGSDPVSILKKHVAVSTDEDGAIGLIASFKRLARSLYTTSQKCSFICRDRIFSHAINPILGDGSTPVTVADLVCTTPGYTALWVPYINELSRSHIGRKVKRHANGKA